MKKPSEQVEAVALRRAGLSYHAIMQRCRVAKSTLWRWLKHEGLVATQPQQITELKRIAQRKAVMAIKASRIARVNMILEQARKEIQSISYRELWLIGIALYWAEGAKQKPHNNAQPVAFSNSDPAMLQVFLRWLEEICYCSRPQLRFDMYIHESGNIPAARQFWSTALQVPSEQFRIRLKRHQRAPHRRNIGQTYVGLVRVTVPQSTALNRNITGWINGITQTIGESANGKPGDFGSPYPGSIPGSPADEEPGIGSAVMEPRPRYNVHGGLMRLAPAECN